MSATEFPTPSYHAKGTKVTTVNGVTGTIVRYSHQSESNSALTNVLVSSDLDNVERWYSREALTVVAE